jgi:hypothetical protein
MTPFMRDSVSSGTVCSMHPGIPGVLHLALYILNYKPSNSSLARRWLDIIVEQSYKRSSQIGAQAWGTLPTHRLLRLVCLRDVYNITKQ